LGAFLAVVALAAFLGAFLGFFFVATTETTPFLPTATPFLALPFAPAALFFPLPATATGLACQHWRWGGESTSIRRIVILLGWDKRTFWRCLSFGFLRSFALWLYDWVCRALEGARGGQQS
jgi:hypothetical protein